MQRAASHALADLSSIAARTRCSRGPRPPRQGSQSREGCCRPDGAIASDMLIPSNLFASIKQVISKYQARY